MITIPAEITKVQRLKNRTVNIAINTHELAPDKAGQLLAMSDFCYVTIKPETFSSKELEELDSMKSDVMFGKTASQRLRNLLYVSFKKDSYGFDSFDAYYSHRMSELMDQLKNEMDA